MVRNTISGPTTLLVADLPFAIMFLALIFLIDQPIVWVLAIILPTFIFLAWRSASKLSTVSNVEKQTGFGRDALIAETIAGRMTVKALSLENTIQPMWEERHAETIEESLVRGKLSDQYVNFGAGLTLLSTIALTTVGALAILDQQMTMGAPAGNEKIVPRVAENGIAAVAADDGIVASTTVDAVVTAPAEDAVITRRANNRVRATAGTNCIDVG